MVSCGLFWKRKFSSNKNRTNGSPVKTIQTALLSKYSPDLKSYISACQQDSNLESFDVGLHQQTIKVINSIANQAKINQSLSLDSFVQVYEFMLELNRDVVDFIIESREDFLENKDLTSLIVVYLQSTEKTLKFCNTVKECVNKTEDGRLIIRSAVNQFETESVETDLGGNKKKRYEKTLEELNNYKAIGDPFGVDFMTKYKSVYEQQILLLEELGKLKVKLDKKQRKVKIWKRVSNVVFMTAFVSVLVLSVVLASMTISPVLSAVASAITIPIQLMGKWCSKMLKEYEKAVKKQKGLVSLVEKGAIVNYGAMKTIEILVDKLRTRISFILQTVEFVVEREDDEVATRLAMQEIKKKVEEFTELINEVGKTTDKCSKIIASGRVRVLGYIISKSPANSLD